MPAPDDLTRRLDTLLDDLLGDRPLEAASVLSRISRALGSRAGAQAQARIARRLRAAGTFSAETAVRAACAMHLGGVPAHRLVHFLSASLPGSVTLSQFELLVQFVFNDDPPVPQQLVYDITQYTYLERKLLTQRSVELATRLKGMLTPKVLLYLYLLSLRDDLSNENVHLIFLILKICFPALKLRGRAREISAAEQREVAAAWRNAQRSVRYVGILSPASSESAHASPPRESASYFLDKYFSGVEAPAAGAQHTPREAAGGGAGAAARLTFTRSSARGGTPRTPRLAPRESTRSKSGPPRPGKRPPGRARAASKTAQHAALVTPGLKPAARTAPSRVLKVGPFVLAGVLLALGALIALRQTGHAPPAVSAPHAAPAAQAAPPTVAEAQAPSAGRTRVVQKGDSLWKIYRSLKSDGSVAGEWKDFLKIMKQRNDLPDPDRIYPGNVLSIMTQGR